ncbi:hypothetical protein Agabi119p4_8888 [Agaricus bisporus var. burnettii]|uniref:F-box domain-containing protein n=1 Tax=Agaricus bisporus var. burnettii TaxID=192524 RepID=A0A8H7EY47_AGABI|nr:hypothetical protein Agabi119p4_8888 [Agaricus bisporus var. burnettii]
MTQNLATSWCPYCLQTKSGATSATLSPGDAMKDALDAGIERQIEHTGNLISSLTRERMRLLRKRNEIRSPIYSLPPEILTLIFKFACPPLDFPREYGLDSLTPGKVASPHILSVLTAVSARWHNLILSTPSLWTSFIANDRGIKLMKIVFAHAGTLPVSARLSFPIGPVSHDHHAAILAPILQEHASQIHMLHVRRASPTWLKEHIPNFVNLEFLCLQSDEREGNPISIESSCTPLVLKDFSRRFSLSWSNIEILHLENTPVNVCLELLQKCTRLIEYRARYLRGPMIEEIQLPSSPFVLPRLKVYEWAMSFQDNEDRAMLQYVRLPALQTDEGFDVFDVTSLSLVSIFCEHLPPTLSAVEIQGGMFPSESQSSTFAYFSNLSNIESLTLRTCSNTFVDDVFSRLGTETSLVGNQAMPVFPKLKSTHIIGILKGGIDQTKILQTFRRSCSQPSELLSGSPFRIEIASYKVNWMPEFKEELVKMVEKGHRVELWEDSKPVDWLPRSQGAVKQEK